MSSCFSFFFACRHPYEDKGSRGPLTQTSFHLNGSSGLPRQANGQIWFVANPEVIQSRHNEISTGKSP